MSINIAREASEVLSFTSNIFKKRVRFGAQSIVSRDDESSSTNSTVSASNMPCHADANSSSTPKRGKPTLNEFRALVKLWKHGMVHGDAEFVANRYSPSAILTCDDLTFRGREAIQEYYEKEFFPKHHPKEVKVLYGNVAVYGEQVHDNGVYDIMTRSGKFLRMKYTFVYARNSTTGRWRIVHHKTAKVCCVSTSGTSLDNRATHRRTVKLEEDDAVDSDSDMESFANASTASSEVIPWGSFPFENGEQIQKEQVPIQSCHESVDRATESGWNQTIAKEPIAEHDTSAHKRRPSEIDRLVALLTGTNTFNNPVVLNVNQGDMAPIERNLDTEEDAVPNRRQSQVDHLVGLLTGTKSVNQDDLILLSLDNKQKNLSTDSTIHRSNVTMLRAQ